MMKISIIVQILIYLIQILLINFKLLNLTIQLQIVKISIISQIQTLKKMHVIMINMHRIVYNIQIYH